MKSASNCRENQNHFLKKERFHCLANSASLFFYLLCLTTIIVFGFNLLFHPRNIKYTAIIQKHNRNYTFVQPQKDRETCDIFQGQWIRDAKGPLYTNSSCTTLPDTKNCLLHGRKDRDFLHWRWKPDQCEFPRFRPETFLSILRGKKMAFIGDSIARNQMESLLCLLSTVETPKAIENNNAERKSATWEFPKHNFTLMAHWTQFLVTATERLVNGTATGSFHLQLDKVDRKWLEKLPSIDLAVFSGAHWFFRAHYLYEGGNFIGCVYCNEPNITYLGPDLAIRKAFRTAFKAINDCQNCKKMFTVLRTYAPQHFEYGAWNTGGRCNRTWPIGKEEVNKAGQDWDYRKIQVEEIEMARNAGKESGNKFEVLDVTEMMLMRPDGHPGIYWRNDLSEGYRDCVHWCMPGPIDTWNELLLELIKRRFTLSSDTDAGS